MKISRRLRGTLGNALVWAAAWFIAAFPVAVLLPVFLDVLPNFTYLGAAMFLAPTLAVMGFVSGGAFSLYLGVAGRNQRLNELRPGWVAVGTGIIVGLLMAAFVIVFVTLRGFPVSVSATILAASISATLAGVTALGQVKIAQKALTPGEEGHDALEPVSERLLPDPDGEAF